MATSEPSRERRRKRLRIILLFALAVVVLRVILPYVLLHLLNDRLARVPGYYGHADDLDLAAIHRRLGALQWHLANLAALTGASLTEIMIDGVADLDREWRKAHNEQPVAPRTLQGLVNRGLVQSETRRIGLRSFRVWTLVDSHRDKLDATPNGAGSLTEA